MVNRENLEAFQQSCAIRYYAIIRQKICFLRFGIQWSDRRFFQNNNCNVDCNFPYVGCCTPHSQMEKMWPKFLARRSIFSTFLVVGIVQLKFARKWPDYFDLCKNSLHSKRHAILVLSIMCHKPMHLKIVFIILSNSERLNMTLHHNFAQYPKKWI